MVTWKGYTKLGKESSKGTEECEQDNWHSINIYYSFDTGEYHESVGLVFMRVPQARA